MPTSVLLAVLAAAGLLALAPALVRRYDATERLVAERASSTARVLSRRRRRRTVPGRRPVNPPGRVRLRWYVAAPPGDPRSGGARPAPPAPRCAWSPARGARPPRRRLAPAHPGGRTAAAGSSPRCCCSTSVELVGVLAVGPGFWIGFAVTGTLLGVVRGAPAQPGAGASAAAAGSRPARRPGWPPGRPRYGASRPGGRRPGARRSAGWPPSGRRCAGRRWAWTATARPAGGGRGGGSVSYRPWPARPAYQAGRPALDRSAGRSGSDRVAASRTCLTAAGAGVGG